MSIIVDHIGDGIRCLVEGDEVVNAGHIIECSAVAATCQPGEPLHIVAFVLQSSGLSKDPHRVDLKLLSGLSIAEVICTCPAG